MMSRITALLLAAAMILAPAIAVAHHPADEPGSDVRTLVTWGGAAVAMGALVLVHWVVSRRRRRNDPGDDADK